MGKPTRSSDSGIVAICWDLESANTVVLGIGIAAIDCATGDVIDQALFKSYVPGMRLDERCWREFWHDKQDILATLEVQPSANGLRPSFDEAQSHMIHGLMEFFMRMEKYASDHNKELHHVSDNKSYDVGLVNVLIERYYGPDSQLPNSPTRDPVTGKHAYLSNFFETRSMQYMLLLENDPDFLKQSSWGYSKHICELWNVPLPSVIDDHNPVNDALFQLYSYRTLLQIADGQYKLQRK